MDTCACKAGQIAKVASRFLHTWNRVVKLMAQARAQSIVAQGQFGTLASTNRLSVETTTSSLRLSCHTHTHTHTHTFTHTHTHTHAHTHTHKRTMKLIRPQNRSEKMDKRNQDRFSLIWEF